MSGELHPRMLHIIAIAFGKFKGPAPKLVHLRTRLPPLDRLPIALIDLDHVAGPHGLHVRTANTLIIGAGEKIADHWHPSGAALCGFKKNGTIGLCHESRANPVPNPVPVTYISEYEPGCALG